MILNKLSPNTIPDTIDKYTMITASIVPKPLLMPSIHVYNWKLFFKVHNHVLLGSCSERETGFRAKLVLQGNLFHVIHTTIIRYGYANY